MTEADRLLLIEALQLHEECVTRHALEIRKSDLLLEAVFRELARPDREEATR